MLIDSGRIDFKNVLKQRDWLCNFSPTEYVLSDEGVSASMRTEPELLKQCNDAILKNKTQHIMSLRMVMPSDIEAPSLDKVISVPVYNIERHTAYKKQLSVKIVEIGEDCQLEMTEAVITKFYAKLEDLKQDKHIKEVLHYSFPSIFPTESPIDAISDENPLKSKMAHWEQLKVLNDHSMDILSRRAKLVELSNIIIANEFTVASLAKKIIVPAGTHVIDLSPINITEQEVLIFPSKEDSNLLIEPVELLRNKTKRNTYRVRNVNKAGGGKRRRKTCRK